MLKSYRENVGKLEKSISTNKKVLEENTEKHDELKKILEDEKARENERKTLYMYLADCDVGARFGGLWD